MHATSRPAGRWVEPDGLAAWRDRVTRTLDGRFGDAAPRLLLTTAVASLAAVAIVAIGVHALGDTTEHVGLAVTVAPAAAHGTVTASAEATAPANGPAVRAGATRRSLASAFPPGSFTPPPRLERVSVYRFTSAAPFVDARFDRTIDETGTVFLASLSAGALDDVDPSRTGTILPARAVTSVAVGTDDLDEDGERPARLPRGGARTAVAPIMAAPAKMVDKTFSHVEVVDARTIVATAVNAAPVRMQLSGILPPVDGLCPLIDGTPETCAARARTQLELFLRYRPIVCHMAAEAMASPIPAQCRVGSTDLAEWLLKSGWAKADGSDTRLLALADGAKRARRGLWR